MSTYSLKIKCKDSQVEVVARDGQVISRELDIYLNEFIYGGSAVIQKAEPTEDMQPQIIDNITLENNTAEEQPQTEVGSENNDKEENLQDFMSKIDILDTFSKCIATAYFFKNKLNLPFFTLKSLNAQFYPITGTFCDISLMENAKSRGYIDQWEDEEGTKYSINGNGESFFTNEICG